MNTQIKTSPKLRLVALLLAIFIGWLGVHRFYVGRIFSGICMVALSLAVYIPIIIQIVRVLDFERITRREIGMDFFVVLGIALLASMAVGIWLLIDVIFIATGNFTDKEGAKIEKWVD